MMEIIKEIDELSFERWIFMYLRNDIFLDHYSICKKESKRHRSFKVIKKYDRLMERDNSIKEEDVPFSDELKKEALSLFIADIRVIKWSERNN